jgi:protein CpxP
MKKILVALSAGALVAVAFVTLTGFHGGPFRHLHDPAEQAAFITNRVDDALDDLDATPAQRTQIHAIKDKLVADVQAHRADRQATHQALLDAWKADAPDKAALHALVDQRAAEMTAMAHEAVDAAVQVHDTLTPDQRAKVTRKLERWQR